jgi:hypothetical protein
MAHVSREFDGHEPAYALCESKTLMLALRSRWIDPAAAGGRMHVDFLENLLKQ